MDIPQFEAFCNNWINSCKNLKNESNYIKGSEFEKEFCNILLAFVPLGYKIVYQKKIKGINYKFDFIIIKSECLEYFYDIEFSMVLAAFEVKSHGFFKRDDIQKTKNAFQDVNNLNKNIKLFYVTFREANNKDKIVNEIFNEHSLNYYRLSDTGDGVQLPPKKYFPEEWNRLMNDLKSL